MPVEYSDDEILLTERSRVSQTRGTILTGLVGLTLLIFSSFKLVVEEFEVQGTRYLMIGIGGILMSLGIYGTFSILTDPQNDIRFHQNGYEVLDSKTGINRSKVDKNKIKGYLFKSFSLNPKPFAHIFLILHSDDTNYRLRFKTYVRKIDEEHELLAALESHFNRFYEADKVELD